MTRVSAINGLGSLARGVEKKRADRCLTQLLPMAAGGDFSVVSEEGPGRRVHRELYLDINGGTQAAAIVACAWLAQRARPESRQLRAVVSAALADGRAPVAVAALRVIAGMPNIRAGHQLEDFFDDSRPSVREAAQQLVGSGSEDTSGT